MLELVDGKGKAETVKGTVTSWKGAGSLSFSSVSVRGEDVYRSRVETGFGLLRHSNRFSVALVRPRLPLGVPVEPDE